MKRLFAALVSVMLVLSACSTSASADVLSTSMQACVDSGDLNSQIDSGFLDVRNRMNSLSLTEMGDAFDAVKQEVVTLFLDCMSDKPEIECVDTSAEIAGNLAECHEVGKPENVRILDDFLPAYTS